MAVQNAARGSTGGVDEQSMAVQNVARGSTGGVDEQSMSRPNAKETLRYESPLSGPLFLPNRIP